MCDIKVTQLATVWIYSTALKYQLRSDSEPRQLWSGLWQDRAVTVAAQNGRLYASLSVSANDVPHVAAISDTYELPFGRGKEFRYFRADVYSATLAVATSNPSGFDFPITTP